MSLCKSLRYEYELKYELNDLMSKLVSATSLSLVYAHFNLSFLDFLAPHFNEHDLYNLCMKILSNNKTELNLQKVKCLNAYVVDLQVFEANYQLRNRLVEFVILNYLNFAENDDSLVGEHVLLVKNLLRFKAKLSKSNTENLIRSTFRPLMGSLTSFMEKRDELTQATSYCFLDTFLCLIEMLDSILLSIGAGGSASANKSPNLFYVDSLVPGDFRSLFQIITFYLNESNTTGSHLDVASGSRSDKFLIYKKNVFLVASSSNIKLDCFKQSQYKLWLNVNMIILK